MMWAVTQHLSIRAALADALFASGLQRCDEPSTGQVRQAVAAAIRAFGYSGCAGRVAQEFGDHPETAVIRMRWAHAATGKAFAGSAPEPSPCADADGLIVVRPRLPAEQAAGSPNAGRRGASSVPGGRRGLMKEVMFRARATAARLACVRMIAAPVRAALAGTRIRAE